MHPHLLRHEQTMNFDNQGSHPDLAGRLLYFLLPYGILLAVSFIFYSKSVTAQMAFPVYALPDAAMQKLIYFLVVGFLGAIGAYVAYGDYWTAYAWILYAVANLLIALYLFLYQTAKRFTLFLTALVSVALAVTMQWLFIETADLKTDIEDLIIRNLVGAVLAWSIVYALITVGQVMVHELGLNKKCQTVFFYIAAIGIFVGLAVWNKQKYAKWEELIGYFVCAGLLLLFAAFNVKRNSNLDLENLLS